MATISAPVTPGPINLYPIAIIPVMPFTFPPEIGTVEVVDEAVGGVELV